MHWNYTLIIKASVTAIKISRCNQMHYYCHYIIIWLHIKLFDQKQSGTTIYLYKIVYFETHNYFLMVEIGQSCTNYD